MSIILENFEPTCQENYSHQLPFPFREPMHYLKPGSKGFFALLVKQEQMRQRSYPMYLLPEVLRQVDPRFDSYISQNQFYRKDRRLVHLLQMNAAFSDADTYKTEPYSGVSPESQAQSLMEYCERGNFPAPSVVVYSGRGLQVKWLLSKPLPGAALPRWNLVQKMILKKLQPFGADPVAASGSTVLRLDQTVNTRSGELVRVLWPPAGQEPAAYTFDTLATLILPYSREAWKQIREQRQQARLEFEKKARQELVMLERKHPELRTYTAETLNWSRLTDLRTLAHLRGYEQGNPDGQRAPFIFLATTFLAYVSRPGLPLWNEVLTLGREWCPEWSWQKTREHVGTVLKMAEQGKRYRFTNQRLIDFLEITGEEERRMRTVISPEEKGRRQRERMRQRDTERRRAAGMVDRQKQASERHQKALELKEKGLNYKEIALELGVTVRHVFNLLQSSEMKL